MHIFQVCYSKVDSLSLIRFTSIWHLSLLLSQHQQLDVLFDKPQMHNSNICHFLRQNSTITTTFYSRNGKQWFNLTDNKRRIIPIKLHHHRPFYGCLSVVSLDLITGLDTLLPGATTKIYLLMFHNSHFALLQACCLCWIDCHFQCMPFQLFQLHYFTTTTVCICCNLAHVSIG
jgi:hypothetical protein